MGDNVVTLQPGTIIGDRYEVVKCLGAGSMGMVYACKHRELQGHVVAVKVLFPEVAQDGVAIKRFANEIFASYKVSHPNVVRAYDYIKDNDFVAYTMEYVPGGDLADKIGGSDQLPIPEILRLLIQMCSGVQAIHNEGIIHRDLKPENILLTKDGNVKIADFGIARTGHGPKLTEHGGVVGTIDYVSPEYMLNSQVDWRSDIYALGILGYEMITGDAPFKGDSVYATMTKRLKTDPTTPSKLRRDCPSELDRIILKAMARNPQDRYQSASEMEEDLKGLVSVKETTTSQSQSTLQENPSKSNIFPSNKPLNSTLKRSSSQIKPPAGTVDPIPKVLASDQTQSISEIQIESLQEEVRMDSVLRPQWNSPKKEIKIDGGLLDEQRMERLSRLAQSQVRSIWIDLLTIGVAVVIGIAIGVVVLHLWFPELLDMKESFSNINGSFR